MAAASGISAGFGVSEVGLGIVGPGMVSELKGCEVEDVPLGTDVGSLSGSMASGAPASVTDFAVDSGGTFFVGGAFGRVNA